jgi:AraC family transcriptional regulator of arabinose operon
MSPLRLESPHPVVAGIVTGYFDEGPQYATWREHGTANYLLILTLSGAGRIGYDDGEARISAGDLVLLRPGTRHDYGTARGAAGWEILWAHFLPHPHWLPLLAGWMEIAPGLTRLGLAVAENDLFERVRASVAEMHRRALSGLPHRESFALNALEEALLWSDLANPRRAAARIDVRVQRAMEFLVENLADPEALGRAPAAAGLSASRLGHLFRANAGQTPQQFLEAARMARAQQLLSLTDRTVTVISGEVGYQNPFYFTLRFKRHTGLAPRDWRRRSEAR